jgi:hypothetical protein
VVVSRIRPLLDFVNELAVLKSTKVNIKIYRHDVFSWWASNVLICPVLVLM